MGSTSVLPWVILAGVLVLAVVVLLAMLLYQKRQSQALQKRFGPEYGRTVNAFGSRTKAESELKARQDRVEHLNIVPLQASDAARFSQSWEVLQRRFVDNPKGVVVEADRLV